MNIKPRTKKKCGEKGSCTNHHLSRTIYKNIPRHVSINRSPWDTATATIVFNIYILIKFIMPKIILL